MAYDETDASDVVNDSKKNNLAFVFEILNLGRSLTVFHSRASESTLGRALRLISSRFEAVLTSDCENDLIESKPVCTPVCSIILALT